jgi:hypothetical protein
MARMHLALSGLGRLQHPEDDARRLFFADLCLRGQRRLRVRWSDIALTSQGRRPATAVSAAGG